MKSDIGWEQIGDVQPLSDCYRRKPTFVALGTLGKAFGKPFSTTPAIHAVWLIALIAFKPVDGVGP
jgi:hypothetical protein